MTLENTKKTDVSFCKSDYEAIDKVYDMLLAIADEMENNDYMFWDFENMSVTPKQVQDMLDILSYMHDDSVLQ